jgi:hypothetical protein
MTKQESVELYGQSVYQIRLSIAMHVYLSKNAREALQDADKFVAALQEESHKELLDRYPPPGGVNR